MNQNCAFVDLKLSKYQTTEQFKYWSDTYYITKHYLLIKEIGFNLNQIVLQWQKKTCTSIVLNQWLVIVTVGQSNWNIIGVWKLSL